MDSSDLISVSYRNIQVNIGNCCTSANIPLVEQLPMLSWLVLGPSLRKSWLMHLPRWLKKNVVIWSRNIAVSFSAWSLFWSCDTLCKAEEYLSKVLLAVMLSLLLVRVADVNPSRCNYSQANSKDDQISQGRGAVQGSGPVDVFVSNVIFTDATAYFV